MKYLKLFVDFAEAQITQLSDAERGRLFAAMIAYAGRGEEGTMKGSERFVWDAVKAAIDRERESYEHICNVNRNNALSGHNVRSHATANDGNDSQQDKDKDKEIKKKSKAFVPPSLDEVKERCVQMGYKNTDASVFHTFYSSKNWMVGKNKMSSWHQALAGWEARNKKEDSGKDRYAWLT